MSEKLPKFDSLEEVQKHFPLFRTATIHTISPISRHEASLRHRARCQSIGGLGANAPTRIVNGSQLVTWTPPTEPNTVDLIELRGSIIMENGAPGMIGEDTGPIYINHNYDAKLEALHDFDHGDIVSIFYQPRRAMNYKGKPEPHPEYIYNHETRVLVYCMADLSLAADYDGLQSHGAHVQNRLKGEVDKTRVALDFLEQRNLIPKQGGQPRPFTESGVTYLPPVDYRGCVKFFYGLLILLAIVGGFALFGWLFFNNKLGF